MKTFTIPAVAALALAGCAAKPVDWSTKTPAEISAAATAKYDKFNNTKTVFGPTMVASNGDFMMTDKHEYYLSSVISYKTNGIIAYGLIVTSKYEARDWRFYDGLTFMGGSRRDPSSKDRKVAFCQSAYVCGYVETLSFILLPSEVDSSKESGLTFRLDGRPGVPGVELSIPKEYIQALAARTGDELAKGPM